MRNHVATHEQNTHRLCGCDRKQNISLSLRFSSLIAAEGRPSAAVSEEKLLPFAGYISLEKIQIQVTVVAIAAKK